MSAWTLRITAAPSYSGGSGSLYSNRLPWEAGVAVAFGLPEEEALKAVTINAAEFMGIDDRVGSLEPGKQATLLITTGTPLDMTSEIEQAYIDGRELDMMDLQALESRPGPNGTSRPRAVGPLRSIAPAVLGEGTGVHED